MSTAQPQSPTQSAGSGEDRREALLRAGLELFMTHPYDEVSAQDVADRAGVAYGLLFHYFGSKKGFFLALLERQLARAQASSATNTQPDPGRWVRQELRMFLKNLEGQTNMPNLVRGSFGVGAEVNDIINRLRTAAAERYLIKLAPERRSELLEDAVRAWVASANDLAIRWVNGGAKAPRWHIEEVLLATLNATLHAVAAVDNKAKFDPDRFA